MFRVRWILLLVLILAGLFLRGMDAFGPFDREAEGFQGGAYGAAAHNLSTYGFQKVGGYPVFSVTYDGTRPLLPEQVYTNHPPTIPLINAATIHVLGESEWALRLPHLIASIAILLFTYLVGLRTIGTTGTLIAVAMTATLPGLVFYGTLVNYENITLAFMMALTWAHLRWAERGRIPDGLLFSLLAFLAALCDWPALLILPLFLLERILPRGELDLWRRTRATFWSGLAGGCGALAALGLHLWLARTNLAHLGLVDAAGQAVGAERETGLREVMERAKELMQPLFDGNIGTWFAAQAGHVTSLVHVDVFGMGLLGFVLCLFPNRSSERARLVIFPGFLAGLLYLVAFAKHSLDQAPFWIYILPFICLGFGFVCSRIVNLLSNAPLGRHGLGVVILLPFALLNVLRYEELREKFRIDSPTRRIGHWLAEQTPADTLLYVPQSAGWNVAYNYYARRDITPIAPGEELLVAPLAALRDLDLEEAVLEKLVSRIAALHAKGLLGYEHTVIVPTEGFGSAARDGEQIEEMVRARMRIEVRQADDLRLIRIGRQDDIVEGTPLIELLKPENRDQRSQLRAELNRIGQLVGDVDVVYTTPLAGYDRMGPLFVGGRWFYFLSGDPKTSQALLHPSPRSPHGLDLHHLSTMSRGRRAIVFREPEVPGDPVLGALMREFGPGREADGLRIMPLGAMP